MRRLFEAFDKEQTERMSHRTIHRMLAVAYNGSVSTEQLEAFLKAVDPRGVGHTNYNYFSKELPKFPMLIVPLQTLQIELRKNCIGEKFWRQKEEEREQRYGHKFIGDITKALNDLSIAGNALHGRQKYSCPHADAERVGAEDCDGVVPAPLVAWQDNILFDHLKEPEVPEPVPEQEGDEEGQEVEGTELKKKKRTKKIKTSIEPKPPPKPKRHPCLDEVKLPPHRRVGPHGSLLPPTFHRMNRRQDRRAKHGRKRLARRQGMVFDESESSSSDYETDSDDWDSDYST